MNLEHLLHQELIDKTDNLVSNINNFSQRLPKGVFYDLGSQLRDCMVYVPEKLRTGIKEKKKIEKVKQLLAIQNALIQCKKYLNIVKTLRYEETDHLVRQIDDIDNMIINC